MKVKKIFASLLAVLLILASVSACGNQNKTNTQTEETTDAPIDTTPVEVEDEGIDFWVQNNAGFENAVIGDEADFQVVWTESIPEKVQIVSYTGTQEHLIIPAEILGKSVTSIADGAFAENLTLKTLIIPNSVTSIGKGILAGCETLHSLQTPLMGESKEGTQYLGYLFGAATHEDNARDIPVSLKCLRLTADWQTLPAYALFDCNDIICLSLPENVTIIEKFAIYNGASLRQIDGIEKIVTFGDRALMNCSDLQIVTLGKDLETVGFGAFEGCNSIRTMTLPFVGRSQTENTYLGYIFGAAQPDFAEGFYPAHLERITLSGACNALGNYAFFECETLKEITLPEGLLSIGEYALKECAMQTIKIPKTVQSIGKYAFYECEKLRSIDIPEGITAIESYTFSYCTRLAIAKLPSSLTKIGYSSFQKSGLEQVVVPAGVTSIGDYAFEECTKLKSVVLPEGLQSIGVYAFCDCVELTGVKIPTSIKRLSAHAFAGCEKLIQVENGVHYVDKWVVKCEKNVTEVVLREDTVGIADSACQLANALKRITLPNGLQYIGEHGLNSGYTLEQIIYDGTRLEWEGVQKGDDWCNDPIGLVFFARRTED